MNLYYLLILLISISSDMETPIYTFIYFRGKKDVFVKKKHMISTYEVILQF